MSFYNWFKSDTDKDVDVVKVPDEGIDIGEMASSNPVGALNSIKRIMDQKNSPPKILVVGDGQYSKKLRNYSLEMAQQHNCEIVALNVMESPSPIPTERSGAGTPSIPPSLGNIEQFVEQSQLMGINVKTVAQIGNKEKAIAEARIQDPSIRFILSEPVRIEEKGIGEFTIFDMNFSRLR